MDYTELIDGLKSAGHDVSGYSPPDRNRNELERDGGFPCHVANPVPKKSPTAASLTLNQPAEAIDEAIARYVEPLEARIAELVARNKNSRRTSRSSRRISK